MGIVLPRPRLPVSAEPSWAPPSGRQPKTCAAAGEGGRRVMETPREMRGEIRSAGWVWEQTLLMACGLRLDLSTGCVCSPKWILRGRHTGDSPPSHRDSVTLNSPPFLGQFPGPPLVRACFNRGAIYGIVTVSRRSSDTSSAALQAGLTCHSRYRPSRYYRPPSFSSRALPLSRAGGKSSKYLASTLSR